MLWIWIALGAVGTVVFLSLLTALICFFRVFYFFPLFFFGIML